MIIKHEEDGVRGTWCFANRNGRLIIHCPQCGGLLINEYGPRRVEENGHVPHSIVCPNEDCSFEDDDMVLEDWRERRVVPRL